MHIFHVNANSRECEAWHPCVFAVAMGYKEGLGTFIKAAPCGEFKTVSFQRLGKVSICEKPEDLPRCF